MIGSAHTKEHISIDKTHALGIYNPKMCKQGSNGFQFKNLSDYYLEKNILWLVKNNLIKIVSHNDLNITVVLRFI